MRSINIYTTVIALVLANIGRAQVPKPAEAQSTPLLITNGTIHIGDGNVVQNGAVAFDNGKITFVGSANSISIDVSGYEAIDLDGKHVYPGLILPSTKLGLEEVSALRHTRDFGEVGTMNPHARSLVAYNTDSELIATMRFNGIVLAQSTPATGIISGTSSIMALDGWNWEDAAYKADDGIHLNWPSMWSGSGTGREANKNYQPTVEQVKEFFTDAKSYYQTDKPKSINLKFEATNGLFSGDKKLYIHSDIAKEIVESLQTAKSFGVKGLVLVGANEAYYVKDYLKDNNIPVIVGLHRTPSRPEEDYDMPYKLPYLLHREGILTGITSRQSLMNARNLPFIAGTAAAYGLDKEAALSMITLNNARILSIDDTTGSLEVGKDANIAVSDGDILDMKSSQIALVYIMGKTIELEGKQQMLYQRFKEKYEKQGF